MLTVTTPHGAFDVRQWQGRAFLEISSNMPGLSLAGHTASIHASVPSAGAVTPADVDVQRYVWRGRPNGSGSGASLGPMQDPDVLTLALRLVTTVRDVVVKASTPARVVEMVDLEIVTQAPAEICELMDRAPLREEFGSWDLSRTIGSVTLSTPARVMHAQARQAALEQHAVRLAAALADLGAAAQVRVHTHWLSTGLTLPNADLTVHDDDLAPVPA